MLFPYTYVPHQMEKMKGFIDFIFYEVWCKASDKTAFSFDLFRRNPELLELMKKFFYSDKKNADFFYGNVERIYGHFTRLKCKHVQRLKWWYCSNNDIERICSKSPALQLAHYADIERRHPTLAKDLRVFFAGLYDFDSADMKSKVSDIDSHYDAFVKSNKSGKCPFCGIDDLQGKYHTKREAYDHYLPKALYPFNSINFRNLVPACHHCNSSYKASKDPAYTPKDPARAVQRRAVFYPYKAPIESIKIKITLKLSDIENFDPDDIDLHFGPAAVAEEIETWKDVYGIEERYKAKLCTESDGKAWLIQVLDEWRELGREPENFLRTLAFNAKKRPFTDCNFLKKPFLDACHQVGII